MHKPIGIAGYGPVGRSLAQRLSSRGDQIIIVQRQAPHLLPAGAQFRPANLENPNETRSAFADVRTLVCTVGVPYVSKIYTRVWPIIMENLLNACQSSGARFVFADNLYMYGPQTTPLTEDMPLTDYGQKPRIRAEITRLWQRAHESGKVRAVSVRAADFYGPDVSTSVLTTLCVVRLLSGKPALAPYPVDQPHDFTYVPDFARALETLIDAPDDAYGQAWHVPNARPTRTLRELVNLAASLIGVPPRISMYPVWLAHILALFNRDVRKLREMRFQWDRPYIVDSSKFSRRFWSNATPFEEGLKSTIEFYRTHLEAGSHSSGGAP